MLTNINVTRMRINDDKSLNSSKNADDYIILTTTIFCLFLYLFGSLPPNPGFSEDRVPYIIDDIHL